MKKPALTNILVWILAGFLLVGAIGNAFVSEEIAADYARWGYPSWFHFVTAACELTAAGLIAYRPTRLLGLALGALVMAAAAGTVLLHGEFGHAVAPVVVCSLCVIAAWRITRSRSTPMTGRASHPQSR